MAMANHGSSIIPLWMSLVILDFFCFPVFVNHKQKKKKKKNRKIRNKKRPHLRGRNGKINGPTEINVPAGKPLVGRFKGRSGFAGG